jgi:PadR family transcriptional regulator, regulatory protein PadR
LETELVGRNSLSFAAAAVLQAVEGGYEYGFDIVDATGLPGGTVYPALRRLEQAGYLVSAWEKQRTALEAHRPPRKYYKLTRVGSDVLKEAIKRYRLLEQTRFERNPQTRKA